MPMIKSIDEQLNKMNEELDLLENNEEDTNKEEVKKESKKRKRIVKKELNKQEEKNNIKEEIEDTEEDIDEEKIEDEENVILDEEGDPERELFEGGPKISQINKWKEEYGEVFATSIDLEMFIWRPLTRKDYKELITNGGSLYDREERYCSKCVLWPENYDFKDEHIKAGLPTSLAEQILLKSGFQPDYTPIQL